jgi:hypothetical protein
MGQAIQVEAKPIGRTVVFETDRSITGQDGTSYDSAEAAASDDRFPGQLAQRLFAVDDELDTVWVASNTVVIERSAGWDDETSQSMAGVIADFFRFYAA